MSKLSKFVKRSYVVLIVMLFYTPLLFAAVFSFNQDPEKGNMSFQKFMGFSKDGWAYWQDSNNLQSITNSLLIAIPTALLVAAIALITSFALWQQKRKYYKAVVDGTSNIPLINPDIITAVGLMLTFGMLFGELQLGQAGWVRTIVAHVVMIVPFGITIMHPRSEKFNKSLIEASRDLGFGPVKTWFNTYFRHMLPVIFGTIVIALTLSLDDFIVTRLVFAGDNGTIGTQLYSGSVRAATLSIGTVMMIIVLFGATIFIVYKKFLIDKKAKAKRARGGK